LVSYQCQIVFESKKKAKSFLSHLKLNNRLYKKEEMLFNKNDDTFTESASIEIIEDNKMRFDYYIHKK
jgi:hypothetical protein